jgi:hypothetical protein
VEFLDGLLIPFIQFLCWRSLFHTLSHPIDPARPTFIGEVSGIDLTRRLTEEEVSAIHAGMDRFGVLVFHDQHFEDEQQIAFSRQLGMLEEATGDIMSEKDRRLSMDLNDISNLDKNGELLPRDDRRRLFGLGNFVVALRQFVQGGAGQVFNAVGTQDSFSRWQHRIR